MSVIIGSIVDGVTVAVFIVCVVLSLLLSSIRPRRPSSWVVFGVFLVLQLVGIALLHIVPSLETTNGWVLCMAEPVYDLGKDAPNLEVGSLDCHAASVRSVVFASICISVAYIAWMLWVRHSYRQPGPKSRVGTRYVVILIMVALVLMAGLAFLFGLL